MGNGVPIHRQLKPPYRVFLRLHKSPGDILVLTAAVRSLHLAYPGQYRVMVETTCPEIWEGNPDVEQLVGGECAIVEMHSHLHPAANFPDAYCKHLGAALGVSLSPLSCPVLCLSEAERAMWLVPDAAKPYLVLMAGTKGDHTVKLAGRGWWQELVDRLAGQFRLVQVGAADDDHHQLDGVLSLIGQTTLRELFSVVYHSAGGVGGVTSLLHICGALGKPYLSIAGGREPRGWTEYPNQLALYSDLPCSGCWCNRTVPLGDGLEFDNKLCSLPVVDKYGDTVPKCLELWEPKVVAEAIRVLHERARMMGDNGNT